MGHVAWSSSSVSVRRRAVAARGLQHARRRERRRCRQLDDAGTREEQCAVSWTTADCRLMECRAEMLINGCRCVVESVAVIVHQQKEPHRNARASSARAAGQSERPRIPWLVPPTLGRPPTHSHTAPGTSTSRHCPAVDCSTESLSIAAVAGVLCTLTDDATTERAPTAAHDTSTPSTHNETPNPTHTHEARKHRPWTTNSCHSIDAISSPDPAGHAVD